MKRKLIAALACRNNGSRLYGKPMQNLDIKEKITVLQYIVNWMRTVPVIEKIVLGISEGADNLCFIEFCKENNLPYIVGDEIDVLDRLIKCGELEQASDVFRISTESPFTHFEAIEEAWVEHIKGDFDFSCLDWMPDGCGFEIIKLESLKYSHFHGEKRHRSELCSLYIRENKEKFKIKYIDFPQDLRRADLRLTIDFPEDLVVCRAVYEKFKDKTPRIPVEEIIAFLDENPFLKDLVDPFVEEGLKTMHL
jgi:spore coat polysaccharide biosynthesis protein SpsF